MKDPMRLIDADGTEFERLLLRAAAQEEPSPDVSARMLAGAASAGAAVAFLSSIEAAGEGALTSSSALASSVQASSGAMQASGAALSGAGGSIAPPAVAGLASTWLVKWGVIGALFTGAVASGWMVMDRAAQESKPSLAAPGQPLSTDARAPAALPAQVPSESGVVQPAAEQPRGAAARAVTAPAGAARSGASSTLGQEIGLLETARQALAAGDAERALSTIASYRRRFPHGALEQEATVLEVDALEAKGREQQASSLKEQFLAEHPDSPHTQRVQRSGQTR